MTAEQSAISRSPAGISEHDMPGGWRVIVARNGERAQTWYHHGNDAPRWIDALRRQAGEWMAKHLEGRA